MENYINKYFKYIDNCQGIGKHEKYIHVKTAKNYNDGVELLGDGYTLSEDYVVKEISFSLGIGCTLLFIVDDVDKESLIEITKDDYINQLNQLYNQAKERFNEWEK